ncbi:MAG: hypothetical protein COA57_16040 [Flavobacteriales bacterium]|nr:MAG: hypothetical protein COA57_16040 [Flavobacteriales bacterium]
MKIIKYIIPFFLAVNCQLLTVNCFAQQIVKIEGQKYYLHYVEKGNTLYSISKKYDVAIGEIINTNPEVEGGLKVDQVLRIPFKKQDKKGRPDKQPQIEVRYISHVVKEKETLYALSKKYNVKVKDILDANPEAINGLKVGQTLKIPSLQSKDVDEAASKPATEDSLVIHHVRKGDTYFSISKKHNVSIDSIRLLNPNIGKLKEYQALRIPKQNTNWKPKPKPKPKPVLLDTTPLPIRKDTSKIKDTYQVALMLPFYLDMNDTIEVRKKLNEKTRIYYRSEIALQFYEGFLLAVDSLERQGLRIKLFIYDTQNDSATVANLLNGREMPNTDLFIGPLFKSNFEIVSAYAKKWAIPVVCPVPLSNKILLGNAHVSKVVASQAVQAECIAEFTTKNYPDSNTIVISSQAKKDKLLAKIFLRKRTELLFSKDSLINDTAKYVEFAKIYKDSIRPMLSLEKSNIIIIPSNDQAFVSDLLTKLNGFTKEYKIKVFGTEKWQNFDNIEVHYLHDLQVHLPCPSFINYSDEVVKSYLRKFKKRYSAEPGKYGILGFDVAYYYLKALQKNGLYFQKQLADIQVAEISNSFYFFKTGIESGYENGYVNIMKYENYELIKVN